MAESTPRPCEFYITASDDERFMSGSLRGVSAPKEKRCPRNLSQAEQARAVPDGITPCPLYDHVICARAFGEELHCPTRRQRREASLRAQLRYNDTPYEE